jgi:simple sugar transport system substrate-binding protein
MPRAERRDARQPPGDWPRAERRDARQPPGYLPRRRFLQGSGLALASVPFLALADALAAAKGAGAKVLGQSSSFPTTNPWPKYPAYRFAMICHLTNDPFFVPARLAANDASALLGTTYTWGGSASGVVDDMVDAFEVAIDDQVDGIACCVVDPKAFNALTDEALSLGIPVVAFNAQAPASSGNHAMAYIGQDHVAAGTALAERALEHLRRGDKAGVFLGAPSSVIERSRLAGATSVFRSAGVRYDEVVVGTGTAVAAAKIRAWYQANRDAKFLFATSGPNGAAVASAMASLDLPAKGVRAAAFDVGERVLEAVSRGTLAFSIDEQAYLQGFLPILQLFFYNISGGLIVPADVSTANKFVTRENVGSYLLHRDAWEGSSTTPLVLPPPKKVPRG